MAEEYRTTAVVLHSIAHGERGHIAYLYTRESGRVSYYIFSAKNGVAQVGSNKISLQPLSVIDIIAAPSPKGDLHRLREAKAAFLTHGIYGDIIKSTIAL
ncbi:MAG: recombination protein O N-terminal domain-containing protein, partial [Rikenellaceae bacterium]